MKKLICALALALPQTACFGLFDAPDAPSAGAGWQSFGVFSGLEVHGNQFHSATLQNGGAGDSCKMVATVFFDAPANEAYRFRAKLTLEDGSWVKSPEFGNSLAGPHQQAFVVDTSADGCWGARRKEILKLDVSGCAGAFCQPNPLD